MLEIVGREFRQSRTNRKRRKNLRRGNGGGGGEAATGVIGTENQEAVDWKFDRLDMDRDGVLRKREFKTFRLSIKQLARNKVSRRSSQDSPLYAICV